MHIVSDYTEKEVLDMYKIDLNSDLGESYGRYTIGMDDRIIPLASSVNVACGFHASDPVVMEKTVALVKKSGTAMGAHPGLPDLMGFGRRPMKISPDEARAYVLYQISALGGFAHAAGLSLQHVKPHGALYNMAAKDYDLAHGICEGIAAYDQNLIVLALYGGELVHAAHDMHLRVAQEFFSDRGYEDDGTLVSRTKEGAIITDDEEVLRRTVRVIREGKLISVTGNEINIHADSICVHGDGEKALEFVERIRKRFGEEGIEICPMSEIV